MSFDNKASIEHGKVIVGTTTNAQQPVSVWGRRKRNTTVFVSVAVIAMATIAVAVTLLTGKKQANAKEASSSLIVSGTEAIDDQFPYVVSFQNAGGSHICGGSLVAKDVVLTSVHCEDWDFDRAVLGRRAKFDTDGEVIGIKSRLPHPDYDYNTAKSDHDFMLVFLDHEYTATNVELISLNSDPMFPFVGQEVTVMGWGETDFNAGFKESNSNVLLSTNMNVISNDACNSSGGEYSYGYYDFHDLIARDQLCATTISGGGPCDSDVGGPLVILGGSAFADVQVGIVSWDIDCAKEKHLPAVFSRVSAQYAWIQAEVCKGSVFASEAGFDCSSIAVSSNPDVNVPTYAPTVGNVIQWEGPVVTKSPTYAPTSYSTWLGPAKTFRACSQSECHEVWQEQGAGNFFIGSYADYGCFRKGVNFYWGEGGTEGDRVNQDLSGAKERILCDCVEEDCFI